MKILSINANTKPISSDNLDSGLSSFVPTAEILKRVNKIKSSWDPQTARARAAEGERRRDQLEDLISELLVEAEMADADCQDADFTVVC